MQPAAADQSSISQRSLSRLDVLGLGIVLADGHKFIKSNDVVQFTVYHMRCMFNVQNLY